MHRWMLMVAVAMVVASAKPQAALAADRPNILFAISDDQSYPYASAYGTSGVKTPAFDRVARSGVLFNNGFVASPGCSPSRAAFLTGRWTWQIEEAGTHASSFPKKYDVFPDLLEASGYFIGMTGKGWGPGNHKISGWSRNPAGPSFDKHKADPPFSAMNKNNYSANFAEFLKQRPKDKPFFFWYGATEPHRGFQPGIGLKSGKKHEDAFVPAFLPDTPEIRSDILDYAVEIEWFDLHLGQMLAALEEAGELENTIVIVTADNGMAFPRAKANCYEYGIHVPLAISWPKAAPGGRVVDDVVSLVDLTPTILEAAGVKLRGDAPSMSGRSILPLLKSDRQGLVDSGRVAYAARERHSSSRYNNWTYPQRALRTPQYLYIRNFKPDRWPAGDPRKFNDDGKLGPEHGGYHDIDAAPSLDFLIEHRDDPKLGRYLHLAVDKRPAEELFDIQADPACLKNLADDPAHTATKRKLAGILEGTLQTTGDPRVTGNGEVWESYPRYSAIRKFPEPQ